MPDKLLGVEVAKLSWALPDSEPNLEFPWSRALKEGLNVHGETLRYRREGAEDAIFLTSCSPVPGSDGTPQGVLVSLDDVTELEKTKQQLSQSKDAAEAANHAKSDFLANMSHEIRTPMNAILGFTEVLRRDIERDENKRRKHLNTIHTSGTHLLNLINDILDLSKVEADRLEVESIPCAVHQVVADVVTVMEVRAEEKGIGLDFQFDGKIPQSIKSDPARLRQILTNLVGNAIKFTDRGGVRIITNLDTHHERPQMVIQVVDTGIGLSEAAAEKIFDPFSQADATVTRRFGGTGLGLSISKRFAEALGGGIRVHSEEGVGSVFIVTIETGPLDGVAMIEPTEEDLRMPGGDEQHLAIRLPNMRVLLVDDGEENRDLMSVILQEAGASYKTAENGLQAIELATSEDWDVILMDMQMPVMDGYTATRTLREHGYDRPIIALTAHAMQQAEQRCRDAGCSGFLSKPIEFDKLITTLAKIAGLEVQQASRSGASSDAEHPSAGSGESVASSVNQAKASGANAKPSLAVNTANEHTPIVSTLPLHKQRFREITIQFVERLDARFDQMQAALEAADSGQLTDLAHALKGASANCGFAQIAAVASTLEASSQEGDLESITAMLGELREMRSRIETPNLSPTASG